MRTFLVWALLGAGLACSALILLGSYRFLAVFAPGESLLFPPTLFVILTDDRAALHFVSVLVGAAAFVGLGAVAIRRMRP